MVLRSSLRLTEDSRSCSDRFGGAVLMGTSAVLHVYCTYRMTPTLLDNLGDDLAEGVLTARCTRLRHHDPYERQRGSG